MLYTATCLFLYICMQKIRMIFVLFFARLFIGAPDQISWAYITEVYATEVRIMGMGLGSMMGRVGAMVTPFAAQEFLGFSLYYTLGVYVSRGFMFIVTAVFCHWKQKGWVWNPTDDIFSLFSWQLAY